mgnify:CR=1 FL=1
MQTVKAFLEATGCKELGLTSPDGKYTVIEVECLGACGFATPILVMGWIGPEQLDALFIHGLTPITFGLYVNAPVGFFGRRKNSGTSGGSAGLAPAVLAPGRDAPRSGEAG